jgi:hypothetical protein
MKLVLAMVKTNETKVTSINKNFIITVLLDIFSLHKILYNVNK